MTTRSSFAFGPDAYAVFLTSVSCVPFCQLWNLYGPLETSIESFQSLLKSCPATLCAGMGAVATSASHAAYERFFFQTTVTDLPLALTDWMSSQPSREVMSQLAFMMVRCVATKSAPV